jgi:antitoxin component YwqK of YwqJK toxin-antitoxin module
MRAQGAYKEWHPNGQLKLSAQVIGGPADITPGAQKDWLFDETSQVWDERGNLIATIPYSKGLLEGHSLYYSTTGQIEKDIAYHNNSMEGDAIEYYANGKIKSQTLFKMGSKEGQSIGYFLNGQPSWIEEYSQGLLLKATYYTPDGTLISEIGNGGGFQAIFDNNNLSLLVEFKHGHPEGIVKQYAHNGAVKKTYNLKNGQKHGEEVEYYPPNEASTAPIKKLSLNWKENHVHGPVKTWYSNGQLESQREYCRNQKMGPALAWYQDGSLMLMEEYEEDRLIKGQYYKSKQKEPVSSIVNGNGVATLYDAEGIFLRKIVYMKGKPVDPED